MEKNMCLMSPGAEGLLGGEREEVRMKKQMLARLEFPLILFGHLAATETLWQRVFSWEPCHKISCDKCNTWFPIEGADVGYFRVTWLQLCIFFFSSENTFKWDRSSVWLEHKLNSQLTFPSFARALRALFVHSKISSSQIMAFSVLVMCDTWTWLVYLSLISY